MRRKTMYYVGGETARWDREDWNRLALAADRFHLNYHNCHEGEYRHGALGVAQECSFYMDRADGKPLTKDEINALSWFFHGVRVSLGLEPCRHVDR